MDVILTHPRSEHGITVAADRAAAYKSQGWVEATPATALHRQQAATLAALRDEFGPGSSSDESSSS